VRTASAGAALGLALLALQASAETLADQRGALLQQLREVHGLDDAALARVEAIFAGSPVLGQGNPAISEHPATPEECRAKLAREGVDYADAGFRAICGAPYMAPLYRAGAERPDEARACIDQFEFPDVPCAYPVVWVRAREAAELCEAVGKRLCDAHEWEGACAGSLEPPDYRFDLAAGLGPSAAIARMAQAHNRAEAPRKSWSYGPAYRAGVCAAASHKSPSCNGGGWSLCGSNTYPSGFFPACHSALGAYDLNGNAAEHMNLPLGPDQMASRGSRSLGYTEMKGSWFIFDHYRAHEDWCRWRAPFWHGSRVLDPNSHHNYHLGFRCCKTLAGPAATAPPATGPAAPERRAPASGPPGSPAPSADAPAAPPRS
jgi:Sulfatase-modifying factor enzyme 1